MSKHALEYLQFLIYRIAAILVILLVIVFLTFAVFYLLPADPAQMACGKPCTPENLERARVYMGLSDPWYEQFWQYVKAIGLGRTFGETGAVVVCSAPCFGYSFQQNQTVTSLIAERFGATASIAVGAAVLALMIGTTTGALAAVARGRRRDSVITTAAVIGTSLPTYLVGLVGIFVFGFTLNVVPTDGYVSLLDDPVQWAWHLVLPWCALALVTAAAYTRVTRGYLADVLESDFIRSARANGIGESRVVIGHGLRNAVVPVLTLFALDTGMLLGGAVITESVFAINGLGRLLIGAVQRLDVPVVVGTTVFSAVLVLAANFVIDIVISFLDPRTRTRKGIPA